MAIAAPEVAVVVYDAAALDSMAVQVGHGLKIGVVVVVAVEL